MFFYKWYVYLQVYTQYSIIWTSSFGRYGIRHVWKSQQNIREESNDLLGMFLALLVIIVIDIDILKYCYL